MAEVTKKNEEQKAELQVKTAVKAESAKGKMPDPGSSAHAALLSTK